MKRAGLLVACVIAAMLWRPGETLAQTEPRVLVLYDDAAMDRDYFNGVWSALGRRPDRETGSFVSFMGYLTGEQWDYVVIVYYRLRSRAEHEALAAALEEHLDRGGTLSFTYPHLDEAPELWNVLGVASAEDPVAPEVIVPTEPRHPAWLGGAPLSISAPPFWGDFGDILTPASGGHVIGEHEHSAAPVMLETRKGHVVVNGLTWDDWGPASGMGRAQTMYLTTCIPDFDDNGILDFFDFLAYQDAFAAGDPRADLDGGGRLTIFDFLAFQDVFAYGCPRLQ